MSTNQELSAVEQHHLCRQRGMSLPVFCKRYGPGRTAAYEEIKLGRLRARKCGKRTIIAEDDAEGTGCGVCR